METTKAITKLLEVRGYDVTQLPIGIEALNPFNMMRVFLLNDKGTNWFLTVFDMRDGISVYDNLNCTMNKALTLIEEL